MVTTYSVKRRRVEYREPSSQGFRDDTNEVNYSVSMRIDQDEGDVLSVRKYLAKIPILGWTHGFVLPPFNGFAL
jgi:hypothetical protein